MFVRGEKNARGNGDTSDHRAVAYLDSVHGLSDHDDDDADEFYRMIDDDVCL